LPPGHWLTASAEAALGRCLVAAGRFAEARPLLERSLATLERERGADNEQTRACAGALQDLARRTGVRDSPAASQGR
jgi:hypothetical protein